MKLSNPLRSKFLNANATLGVPTLVRLFAGMAKSKTSAIILGPIGVGIVGIGSQLQNLGATFTSLGASSGFTRELSRRLVGGDLKEKRDLLGTSFTLQLLVNVPILLLGLGLLRPLAHWTFGNDESSHYLLPILVTIPLQSVMVTHLWSVFYAHGRLEFLARASVIAALVEAASYIVLVKFYGVPGAFWGTTIGMTVWFAILVRYAGRLEKYGDLFHLKLEKRFINELLNTGAIMTLAGVVTYLTNAMIRIKITRSLGGPFAGVYQVVMALTAYYIPYFTNGVWGRLFPKICASGLDSEGKYEWSEALILISILAAAVQICLMAFAGPLVSLFYSRDFDAAIPLAPLQFVGDLFYLISIPCLGVIMGLNRMRLYVVIWVAYYAVFYGLAVLMMDQFGLRGAIGAYLISDLALAAFCLAFFFRKLRGSPHLRPTFISIAASATAASVQAAICLGAPAFGWKLILPLLWGAVAAAVLVSPAVRQRLLIHAH